MDCVSMDPVKLQVGDRVFHTTKWTLTRESAYFAAQFSSLWAHNAGRDGVYFIDSDPTLFAHILKYLRTGRFPIFFDTVTMTHKPLEYDELLAEARYFQIPRLVEWIVDKAYLRAVQVRHVVSYELHQGDVLDPQAYMRHLSQPLGGELAPTEVKTEFVPILTGNGPKVLIVQRAPVVNVAALRGENDEIELEEVTVNES